MPFQGVQSPQAYIFDGVLIVWVPVLLNLISSKSFFTRTCLSYVRVIMAFMRVSLIEPLSQAVMEQILALKYMLSGARRLLRPHPVIPGA
jgi:hypothetical protein